MSIYSYIVIFLCFGGVISILPGCATARPTIRYRAALKAPDKSRSLKVDAVEAQATRRQAALNSAGFVGKSVPKVGDKTYRKDCSGTVRAIYASAGAVLGGWSNFVGENDASILYRYISQAGVIVSESPMPGDLVFFRDTYELPKYLQGSSRMTHVGVVEKVDNNGTVIFVHYMGHSIVRSRMNLLFKNTVRDKKTKERLNHMLRRRQRGRAGATTGQLFAGFGRIYEIRSRVG